MFEDFVKMSVVKRGPECKQVKPIKLIYSHPNKKKWKVYRES